MDEETKRGNQSSSGIIFAHDGTAVSGMEILDIADRMNATSSARKVYLSISYRVYLLSSTNPLDHW